MDISIWVPVIVAAIAIVPGTAAYFATRKQREADARAQTAMAGVEGERVDVERDKSAIEGFVRLVEHLQEQIAAERTMHELRIKGLEAECKRKLADLQVQINQLIKRQAEDLTLEANRRSNR